MKTLFYLISFILLVVFGLYFVNNMEKFVSIGEKDIIGTYQFTSENTRYKIMLKEKNLLAFEKNVGNNVMLDFNGTWSIKTIGITPYIDANISGIDSVDFDLGKIKKNLFFKNIQIEALSIGNFYGEENNAFLIKQ